jgi:hypothetical protein
MVVLKGSVPMAFGGTQEPAAYGELVSIGGLNPDVNKKLSAGIASILESKLSVPKSRFYLKFYDSKASRTYVSSVCLLVYRTCSHCKFCYLLGPSGTRTCSMFACFASRIMMQIMICCILLHLLPLSLFIISPSIVSLLWYRFWVLINRICDYAALRLWLERFDLLDEAHDFIAGNLSYLMSYFCVQCLW